MLEIHPKFLEWADNALSPLPAAVADVSDLVPPRDRLPLHPDHPVTTITPDQLRGDLTSFLFDDTGKRIAFASVNEEEMLGLIGEDFETFAVVADRLCRRKEIADVLASASIWRLAATWVISKHRNDAEPAFSICLADYIKSRVHEHRVWVPIEGMHVEGNMIFSDAVFRSIAREEISDVFIAGRDSSEDAQKAQDAVQAEYGGRLVAEFVIEAEAALARSMAVQKAKEYCNLFQLFNRALLVPERVSVSAPRWMRPAPSSHSFARHGTALDWGEKIEPQVTEMVITRSTLKRLRAQFELLSLLTIEPKNDYTSKLADALDLYGSAAYQPELSDKLLYITSAVEMTALRDDREPIVHAVGDRLAFAIAEEPAERETISKNFREAYGLRSRRTHHGQTVEANQALRDFMRYCLRWFMNMLRHSRKFETHAAFLKYIDDRKYGVAS